MFVGITSRTTDDFRRAQIATDKAIFRNVRHASLGVRKTAIDSIQPGDGPSPPGRPPHTHTQRVTKKGRVRKGQLPRAIVYSQDKGAQSSIIGPRFSVSGTSGEAHEFGGKYKDETFPKRPFMGPALEANAARFGNSFRGSIGA